LTNNTPNHHLPRWINNHHIDNENLVLLDHVENSTLLKFGSSSIEISVPCLTSHDTCPKAYLLPGWKNRLQFVVQNLSKNE
jgi:hypothetical protein